MTKATGIRLQSFTLSWQAGVPRGPRSSAESISSQASRCSRICPAGRLNKALQSRDGPVLPHRLAHEVTALSRSSESPNSRLISRCDLQNSLSHRKTIVAGKHEVNRSSVLAHPFGRRMAGLARADVPLINLEHGGPRAPRLGRVV